ncbi:hypothetical protein DQ04_01611130 [Trypanosoma grayi]|uniref:hypothetical protein n=1 Tax=Trypanosoma grayi TaxID=71804 RepID=UPI0004F3FFA1|nr:hypothetical protein DQ04_01611130 [Trypanosoma grayi]KEG12571.1 hypothetical protein DQ04_01611130 [Trypanosoma grayi]
MSSHSSDVYVMESAAESSSTASACAPEGLVRSHSCTHSESSSSSSREADRYRRAERPARAVGTNTEEHVEERVSSLLHSGIMDLMRTVAGDAFANQVARRDHYKMAQNSTEEITAVARSALNRLRELGVHHLHPKTVQRVPSEVAATDIVTAAPEWLEELQKRMEETDNLLHDLTVKAEKIPEEAAVSKTNILSLVPAATPRAASHQSPPSSWTPPHDNGERIQGLEAELRKLQEEIAETRVVLAKEGVHSVLPLYNELLNLRETKQQAALRDAETTAAYLFTQDCCFRQQLDAIERRKKMLDHDSNSRCYNDDTATTLLEDVEKLAKLGRDLNQIRDEYQKHLTVIDMSHRAFPSPQPGEKRSRTSEDCFEALIERETQSNHQILSLRRELDAQMKETEAWKQRYEAAVKHVNPPQDSNLFASLLQDIEGRLSLEANRRCTLLCNIFGWKLLDMSIGSLTIGRMGCFDEQLTLPLGDSAKDERSVLATSIVLARKLLEGCGTLRGNQQGNSSSLAVEGGAASNRESKVEESEEASTANEEEEESTTATSVNISETGGEENHDPSENAEVDAEPPLQEDAVVKDSSPASAGNQEPSFYSSGLWE